MNFAQTEDLREGFYKDLDELDEVFSQRVNTLETEVVEKFSNKRNFYEYLKVHESIYNILERYKVNKDIIKEVRDELNKQVTFFSDDMLFFSNYYFKAGAIYGAKVYKQLLDNKDNTTIEK